MGALGACEPATLLKGRGVMKSYLSRFMADALRKICMNVMACATLRDMHLGWWRSLILCSQWS
jgi:hypothetical protein